MVGPQGQLLKTGLQRAGLWPKEGEVSPSYGLTPQEMRRSMRSMLTCLDGEILLTAYYVLLLLTTFCDKDG
jgi:hypothetical protein